MGRAPCCEKMGLKKGPWTTEEDRILVNYINQNGHGNWRALPKRAGLLRCGKSCRLRWMNYLRPDIKRGNFTREEEDSVINLHKELGNRWSVIAAKLPGRTDNEIKNIWHTHLKKRLNQKSQPEPENHKEGTTPEPNSPAYTSSEISSITTAATVADGPAAGASTDSPNDILEMDESFWSEVLSGEDSGGKSYSYSHHQYVNGGMHFWAEMLYRAELNELPEF